MEFCIGDARVLQQCVSASKDGSKCRHQVLICVDSVQELRSARRTGHVLALFFFLIENRVFLKTCFFPDFRSTEIFEVGLHRQKASWDVYKHVYKRFLLIPIFQNIDVLSLGFALGL